MCLSTGRQNYQNRFSRFRAYPIQPYKLCLFFLWQRWQTKTAQRHPLHQRRHKYVAGLCRMGRGVEEGLGYWPPVSLLTRGNLAQVLFYTGFSETVSLVIDRNETVSLRSSRPNSAATWLSHGKALALALSNQMPTLSCHFQFCQPISYDSISKTVSVRSN